MLGTQPAAATFCSTLPRHVPPASSLHSIHSGSFTLHRHGAADVRTNDPKAPLLPLSRRPRPLAQLARTAGVLMREMAADAERRYTAGKPDIANRSRGCLGRDERQPCQLLGQRTLLNALAAIVDAGVAFINSLERIFTWITIRETSLTRLGLRARTSANRTDHSTKDRTFEATKSLPSIVGRKKPR